MKVCPNIIWNTVEHETLIKDLSARKAYSFDEIGTAIWTKVIAGKDMTTILAELIKEYDKSAPQIIENDTNDFIAFLQKNGIIE